MLKLNNFLDQQYTCQLLMINTQRFTNNLCFISFQMMQTGTAERKIVGTNCSTQAFSCSLSKGKVFGKICSIKSIAKVRA